MEMQKAEIVIYIYHINKKGDENDIHGEMPGSGTPKQQAKLRSCEFLSRAARHYVSQHAPAALATAPGLTSSSFWRTQKGSHGKPCFPDCPWLHFSISHSGEYWACAMALTEVGLDLQQHTKGRKERISARFFHPQENEYLRSSGYRGFFDVWAAKESYVKYTGQGIDENFAAFTAAAPTALAAEINGVRLKVIPFCPDYSLCLCAADIDSVIIHYEA